MTLYLPNCLKISMHINIVSTYSVSTTELTGTIFRYVTSVSVPKDNYGILGINGDGLYSAEPCGGNEQEILVLKYDQTLFRRATYINQARVHQGYHYPRTLSNRSKVGEIF